MNIRNHTNAFRKRWWINGLKASLFIALTTTIGCGQIELENDPLTNAEEVVLDLEAYAVQTQPLVSDNSEESSPTEDESGAPEASQGPPFAIFYDNCSPHTGTNAATCAAGGCWFEDPKQWKISGTDIPCTQTTGGVCRCNAAIKGAVERRLKKRGYTLLYDDGHSPGCIEDRCISSAPVLRTPDWPSYLDAENSSITTSSTDGDARHHEPCTFGMNININPNANQQGGSFQVGILHDSGLLFQSTDGMNQEWAGAPLACGESIELDIVSFREAEGLSLLAHVKLECGACDEPATECKPGMPCFRPAATPIIILYNN